MKLTENLPGINDRTLLVYLMSVDLNGFLGLWLSTPLWLQVKHLDPDITSSSAMSKDKQ